MRPSVWETPLARVRRRLGAPTSLAGRVVLVTGASSGIGEATAVAAAGLGATVLLVARRGDELDRVQGRVEASGGRAASYVCDMTDPEAIDALVERVLAEHGHVDHLVNNAGRSIRRSLAASAGRFHDVERTIAINYLGPVRLTMGLLPVMRERGFGHVVNILSWGIQIKAPKFGAYQGSKAALDVWSRSAGRETYADGVVFTNMRFGLVQTPMIAGSGNFGGWPAASAEEAAAQVVRALQERPASVNTWSGRVSAVLDTVAPRLVDAAFSRVDGPRRAGGGSGSVSSAGSDPHPPLRQGSEA